MKKIMIIMFMLIGTFAIADNENEGILYILKDNPNINTLIYNKPWRIVNNDGTKVLIWNDIIGTNAPTFAEIYAVTNVAVPWYNDKVKDTKADIDEISPEVMKSIVTAMIKVINIRVGTNKITAAEMKTAIKNELR